MLNEEQLIFLFTNALKPSTQLEVRTGRVKTLTEAMELASMREELESTFRAESNNVMNDNSSESEETNVSDDESIDSENESESSYRSNVASSNSSNRGSNRDNHASRRYRSLKRPIFDFFHRKFPFISYKTNLPCIDGLRLRVCSCGWWCKHFISAM